MAKEYQFSSGLDLLRQTFSLSQFISDSLGNYCLFHPDVIGLFHE